MSSRDPTRWALAAAALACALFAVLSVPFLTKQRELVAGVPSPRAVFEVSLIAIEAHERLCISGVTIPLRARYVRFDVGTYDKPGPPLRVTLRGAGYATGVDIPGGYADDLVLSPAMTPPRRALLGSVCIANRGDTKIALTGSTEGRTASRPVDRVDGKVVAGDAYLGFFERRSASVLERAHDVVRRMSVFRPGVVGTGVLWVLLVLVLVGIPAGLLLAVLGAVRGRSGD